MCLVCWLVVLDVSDICLVAFFRGCLWFAAFMLWVVNSVVIRGALVVCFRGVKLFRFVIVLAVIVGLLLVMVGLVSVRFGCWICDSWVVVYFVLGLGYGY